MTQSEIVMDEEIIRLSETEASQDSYVEALVEMENLQIADVMALTARLAQVMAQEADMLEEMRIGEIAKLQDEKVLLTNALESAKRQLKKHPELLEEMTDEERDDLEQLVKVFNAVRDENFHRLTIARAVNHKVVEAITDVVAECRTSGAYTTKGDQAAPKVGNMSVTVNKKV